MDVFMLAANDGKLSKAVVRFTCIEAPKQTLL